MGSRINALRIERGMTQLQLADALGVSLRYIKHILAGTKNPSPALIVDVSELFGVTTDYIMKGCEERD